MADEFKLTKRHQAVLRRVENSGPAHRQSDASPDGIMGGGLHLLDACRRQEAPASDNARPDRARVAFAIDGRVVRRVFVPIVRPAPVTVSP